MKPPPPNPERFKRAELQEAYELGWMLEEAGSSAAGAERMAAMLDGAADALHALVARQRREDVPALRALDEADL